MMRIFIQQPHENPTPKLASIRLQYAPDLTRRRRRLVKRVLFIVLLLVGSVATWREGPHGYAFAKLRYWQYRCMNFHPSPDIAVFEIFPAGSQKPAANPGYVDAESPEVMALRRLVMQKSIQSIQPSSYRPSVIFRQAPICFVRFLQQSGNHVAGDEASAVVFCGKRVSPAGHVRLMTVEYPGWMLGIIGDTLAVNMTASVYAPAEWNSCKNLFQGAESFDFSGPALPPPRHIFAGQPDPSNPSHLTISYEWPDGTRGIVDGWLRDNDTVDFNIRPGPGDIQSAYKLMRSNPQQWREHR